MSTQDIAQHQRDRIRKLEQRVNGLTRYRDQLEQAFALACELLVAGTTTDPAQVAAVIHDLTEGPDITELLQETAAA